MVVTSLLAFTVVRRAWGWPLAAALAVMVPILALEVVFLGANLAKVLDGGFVPLLIAAAVGVAMTTWVRGTDLVRRKAHAASMPLAALMEMLHKSPPVRVSGCAVFLTSDAEVAPDALLHNLKHNRVLHARNLVVTVMGTMTPRVSKDKRIAVEQIDDDFLRVRLRFGYMEQPNVPKGLALAKKHGIKFDIMSTSFFLNRRSFRASPTSGMPLWQDRLFIAMSKAASDASGFYRLPSNRVVELGQQFIV